MIFKTSCQNWANQVQTLEMCRHASLYITITQYVHLWELGSSSSGNLGHTELGQFIFQVVQLLEQLLLLLAPQISCLDLGLTPDKREIFLNDGTISIKHSVSGGIRIKIRQLCLASQHESAKRTQRVKIIILFSDTFHLFNITWLIKATSIHKNTCPYMKPSRFL